MADTEKKPDTKSEDEKNVAKPTGEEHWGEGGRFYIDSSGKRVRKPTKKN